MYENTISEILKAQTDKEELGKIVENLSLIHISEPTRP